MLILRDTSNIQKWWKYVRTGLSPNTQLCIKKTSLIKSAWDKNVGLKITQIFTEDLSVTWVIGALK